MRARAATKLLAVPRTAAIQRRAIGQRGPLGKRTSGLVCGKKKWRLADEYDAAQERGEIRTQADNQAFSSMNTARRLHIYTGDILFYG